MMSVSILTHVPLGRGRGPRQAGTGQQQQQQQRGPWRGRALRGQGPRPCKSPWQKKCLTHLKKGRVKWHRNSPRCEKVRFESLHLLLQPGQRDDDCWYNWARFRRSSWDRRRLHLDRCHCPCQQNWICNRE